mmetsp:Transcript_20313/g.61866  ORF Transcript_20313/g.61866 Transcript_20313/m.61866 type:complete len:87 (+) Transcript_20313:1611-1871(+)
MYAHRARRPSVAQACLKPRTSLSLLDISRQGKCITAPSPHVRSNSHLPGALTLVETHRSIGRKDSDVGKSISALLVADGDRSTSVL